MSKKYSQYFTTSEIAKTCGVTKHTLFHYDEIGLLKPEFTNSKGYRFYTIQQCYALDIINVLKKTGSSLKEIKGYIHNQKTPALIELLKQKLHDLEVERNKIVRMEGLLNSAIEMTELAKGELHEGGFVEECEEEYFLVNPLEQGDGDKEFAYKLNELRDYCENQLLDCEFPIWTILSTDRLASGVYYPDFISYKLKTPISGKKMIIKPKGSYAVINHRGSYETMPDAYSTIKLFIAREGLQICGNAYAVELLNYLTEKNPDDYIVRISVEICRT